MNVWGESWVLKAANKVETIPDDPFWLEHPCALLDRVQAGRRTASSTSWSTPIGQPFADAALSEREDNRQLGANNFWLAPHFVKRLAHLGWGFGPSITALGLKSVVRPRQLAGLGPQDVRARRGGVPARRRRLLFQELNMPDDSWNPKGLDIPLRRPVRDLRAERLRDRHGHDGHLAVRPPAGRPGRDPLPVDVPGHVEPPASTATWRRWRPGAVGRGADRAEDAAEPARQRRPFLTEFPYLAPPW